MVQQGSGPTPTRVRCWQRAKPISASLRRRCVLRLRCSFFVLSVHLMRLLVLVLMLMLLLLALLLLSVLLVLLVLGNYHHWFYYYYFYFYYFGDYLDYC